MKNTHAALLIIASIFLIFSSALSADDQKNDNKKGGGKQSEGHPHQGKQAAPHTNSPQKQQSITQVALQQSNGPQHVNNAAGQQPKTRHFSNQEARLQSGANLQSASQNLQSGAPISQSRKNRGNQPKNILIQQSYNSSARASHRSSVTAAAPQMSQSANAASGYQQYQVTPNAQYNRNNNYGGLWSQANTHNDWNHNGQHYWNNHNYRWYEGGWLIIDGFFNPYYGNIGYSNQGSMASSVQASLANQGYYNGPIDGDVGPGTRNAIANYQRDNNLYVSGRITNELLKSLQLL